MKGDLTAEQRQALDAARFLAEYGVPLFLAARDPKAETGFRLPKRWQHTKPDPRVVDRWRPGMALCAVMGHGVDAVDVDPRNGGDASLAELRQTEQMPRVYAVADTPSGGEHYLVASLDVHSRDGVLPGVDVKAGGADGSGRGFVFIAPTVKVSKVTGQPAPYRWAEPPGTALEAVCLIGGDDSGAALRDRVNATRRGSSEATGAVPYDGPGYADLSAAQQRVVDEHVAGKVAHWRAALAAAADWAEGERDEHGRGWEALARDAAWALATLAYTPWAGVTEEAAEQFYADVMPAEIASDAACRGKWTPGLLAKAQAAPVDAPPWADSEPVPDEAASQPDSPTSGSKVPLSVRLRQYVESAYNVFPDGERGVVVAQPKSGGRAEPLTNAFVMRVGWHIGEQFASFSQAATEAARVLCARGDAVEPKVLSLRVDYRPRRIVLDLGQRGNMRCAVVTPGGWTVQDRPPPDVAFRSPGVPLPDPVRGGSLDEFRDMLLREYADDSTWLLLKGWLVASLLADKPRPLVALWGSKGSGKTSLGRFLIGLLDPRTEKHHALGGAFGKQLADDETKARGSYLTAWDNLTSISSAQANFLSRLVTGDLIEKRKLYTDQEVVQISYRRTGVITGITPPRGIKEDTLDRLIMVTLERPKSRIDEGQLEAWWPVAHPRMLGGLLDLAATMLAGIQSGKARNPRNVRMADYASALHAVAPALYDAYADSVATANADMAAEDPFVSAIVAMLDETEDGEWEGTAEEGRGAADLHRYDQTAWWPDSARAFSDAVARVTELLSAVGVSVTRRRSNGVRLLVFRRIGQEQE